MVRRVFFAGMLIASAVAALADGDVVSGPEVGKPVPELKVLDITGPQKDKELDYVAERKNKPTVYILVKEFDRPVARFMKLLDTAMIEDGGDRMAVAAWITADKGKTKEYLPRVQMSIKLEKTAMTVYLGDPTVVAGWDVNQDARITVVVAAKGKVTARWGYQSVNDTLVRPVRQALTKAAS